MRWTYAALSVVTLTAGCGDTVTEPEAPDPLPLEYLWREAYLEVVPQADLPDIPVDEETVGGLGAFTLNRVVGTLGLQPRGIGPDAYAEAYSDVDGGTYWVFAEASSPVHTPPPSITTEPLIGSSAELTQAHMFRKVSADASLRFVISRTVLHGLDDNGLDPRTDVCRWLSLNRPVHSSCRNLMRGSVSFDIEAWTDFDGASRDFETLIFETGGKARLYGFHANWQRQAYTSDAGGYLWGLEDFEWVADPSRANRGGELKLRAPITVEIPLDSVAVGDTVGIASYVKARAYSRRRAESYMAAFFRDPLTTEGSHLIMTGLEPVHVPDARVPSRSRSPVCEGGPAPAGTLQFDSLEYFEPEQHGASAWITVSRKGGVAGVAAVRVVTRDHTARAGEDYVAGERLVTFADGEEGVRVVEFEILSDTIAEPEEALYLDLVEVGGCGEIGSPRTATILILDDDNPPPEDELYSLGGTVSGVVGTGLTLTNLSTDSITPGNGPFTFEREYPRGAAYHVRVSQNPDAPAQACTVTNGDGFFSDTDVTDVAVACTTIEVPDGLDPTFGIDGKVTAALYGGAHDMVLQPDGRPVVVGDRQLARYLTDGSPDPSFGTGGVAEPTIAGSTLDLKGLALQEDGAIIAVGSIRTGDVYDWVVARVLSNGTPDPGFGTDGFATLDFRNSTDIAYDAVVLGDGSIVVGGHANERGATGADNDFAVARFTSTGALDTTYGSAGWTMTDIAGETDFGYALALQPDGKVILVGRVARNGGTDPDFGIVRYAADGRIDDAFGANGVVRFRTDRVWDEAADVIVQPDGRIVVGGHSNATMPARFALMRLETDGVLDPTFGIAGLAFIGFDREADYLKGLAWDDDGILAVGSSRSASAPAFAVARVGLDGTVDTSFATDGKLLVDFFGVGDVAHAVRVQSDGKVVVAGSAYEGRVEGLGMIRINR